MSRHKRSAAKSKSKKVIDNSKSIIKTSGKDRYYYKYQFVSPPPDDVICPVCLDIVEEPYQFTCCGQHVCRICRNKLIQQVTTPQCPMCRHNKCITSPDKYFERNVLNNLWIWCTEGCGQKVKLGQLKNHLQQCPCIQEDCPYGCGQQYQRQHMRKHKGECPKRPFDCRYCGYQSTHEVIVNEHHPVCDKYPINCPNECYLDDYDDDDDYYYETRMPIERGMLQDHLDKCPLQLVECEFSHVGCKEKLHRCDLAQHLSDSSVHHTALSSKMIYESVLKTIEEKDRQLQEKDAQLAKKDNELKETIQQKDRQLQEKDRKLHQKDRQLEEKDKKLHLLLSEVRQLREQHIDLKHLVGNIHEKVYGVVLSVTMEDFSHKYKHRHQWFSPPYFTDLLGYKMCFEVDFKCHRTSLCINSYMMSGPYDNDLEWPFEGQVIVRLLNQLGDHHHYDYVFDYEDMTEGGRVIGDKQGDYLITQSKYLPLDKLNHKSHINCQYLKDDCLKFKVIVPP